METVLAFGGHCEPGALLQYIVNPPHGPHALGEVRVEVTVVNRIAGRTVAVSRAAVGDFIGVARPRAYALGILVVGVVVIGVEQPLVAVQVEHMLFVADVGVAEFDEIADVAVADVGRFGRVQRHARLDADAVLRRHLARAQPFQANVGRYIHQHRGVADGVGTEEEFLIGTG